jgi:YVTN family beta-propeller protein
MPPAAPSWGQIGAQQQGNPGTANLPPSFTPWLHNQQAQQGTSNWGSFSANPAAQPQSQFQQSTPGWNGFSNAPGAPSQPQTQQNSGVWGASGNLTGMQPPQMPPQAGSWGAFNPAGTSTLPPQQQMQEGAAYGFGTYAPPMWGNQGPAPEIPGAPQKRKASKQRRLMMIGLIVIVIVVLGGAGAFIYRTIKHSHPALTALSTVQDISLGNGPPTRFDYQSLDPASNLLLISRSGANSVLLFNIQTRQVVAEIPGIADGHGIYAVDAVGHIYASAGGSDQVVVIDAHSYKILARINVGKGAGPDGMAYDPVDQKLFVSDETGNNDAVINVRTDKLLTEIPLGGNAGNTQYDAATDTIYVNEETHNQLDAINPKTNQIVGHYALSGCQDNHGMQIDSQNRLLFIACVTNATLIELNMKTMQQVDHATIGNNPDVLALDQSRHLLYVASESGIFSIFVEQGSTVHKLAEGYIAPHAHTVGVDQQTHLIYLPLENLNGHPVIRIAQFNPPAGS